MALLLAQSTATIVQVGPFVDAIDADTILPSLTLPPGELQVSSNGGPFAPTNAATAATPQGLGYYQVTLNAADTAVLGTRRLSIQHAGALPVWLDLLIVPLDVWTRLQGLTSALLVLEGSTTTMMVGPFVSISDGATVLSGLPITQANIQLSKSQALPAMQETLGGGTPAGFGHYQVTLGPSDTDTPGTLRLAIDPPSALPVWMDVMVVALPVWQIFYPPAPPVIVVPPGPPSGGISPGGLVAGDLLARIAADLDDATLVHTSEDILLRLLSRAQQWVALRYRLLRHTVPLALRPTVPWYALAALEPLLVVATQITTSAGVPLQPVPISRLRYSNPQWLATSGMPTRYYRIGWTYVGFTPVPDAYTTCHVTGLMVPARLLYSSARLEVPEAYADACVHITVGLALLGRERTFQEGLARIAQGLGSPATAATTQGDTAA